MVKVTKSVSLVIFPYQKKVSGGRYQLHYTVKVQLRWYM